MKIIHKYKNFIFSLMWIGVLINFNSHPNDIIQFLNTKYNSSYLWHFHVFFINFIRATSLYLIILFILFFFIKNITIKRNIILDIFYLFIFIQLISFLMNRNILNELDQFYYWLNYLLVITFFYYFYSINDSQLYKKFFYIFIGFILIVSVILLSKMYGSVFSSEANNFYYSYFVSPGSKIFNQGVPRVTGIARILSFLIIFNMMIFMYQKNKVISFITLLFFVSSLFLTQSRASIIGVITLGLFLCIFDKNFSFVRKIIFFTLILSFAFLFQISIPKIKVLIYDTKINIFNVKTEKDEKTKNWEEQRRKDNAFMYYNLRITQDFSTSGRLIEWKKLLRLSKDKILMGYGFQADRYLISTTASSAYLYSLITSGILGLTLFLIIIFSTIKKCLKQIFKNKIFSKDKEIILKSCILINIFITGRTIIENSFAVYNFDLVIFLLTYLYIDKYEKNFQKDYN